MQFFKLVIITTALTAGLIGQDAPVPPVQAKRLPPDKTKRKVPPGSDNLIDRYDFGAQSTLFRTRTPSSLVRRQSIRCRHQIRARRRLVSPPFLPVSSPRPTCNSPRRHKKPSR